MLFTFAAGSGHLEPLVPLAGAAQARGHVVAFSCRPWMVPKVEALGFAAFAAGPDSGLTPKRLPLAALDLAKDIQHLGTGFGRRVARGRATDLLPQCSAWQPDLLVCEEMDYGAMVVAERLGLPFATVLIIASGAFVRPGAVAPPLNEVRAEHGLPADDTLAMPGRYLVLSPFPPSFRDPAFPLPATAQSFRLSMGEAVDDEPAPSWLAGMSAAPAVYFTLGTVFNSESGDLFARVLAGLRDLPINVIVTTGREVDPSELGTQPAHVHIEQFIPQALILPRCQLVVAHGGSGSVMGALTHGKPMVLIPLGADQPLNAARCQALGVARVLDALAVTPQEVAEAVSSVLAEPSYRHAAERLRDEIAALPGPEHAAGLLEQLATEKRAG